MTAITLSLALAIFAQVLNACIVLIDKYIVTSTHISRPSAYAFYVSIISGIVLILVPFGVIHIPSLYVAGISILIGVTFIASILLLYNALKIASATDVVPWLAAVSTIITFVSGFLFLEEDLPRMFPYALVLFVIGMLLVGHFRFNAKSFSFVVLSGIFFGISAVLLKMLFSHTDFVNGFFWSRMGNVLGGCLLLLSPSCREAVFHTSKDSSHKTTFLIVLNRALGGIAFLCTLYAIRVGSVSIVNSLSSLQFVFIFLFIFLLKNKMPKLFAHEFRPGHVLHKLLAMLFIVLGFFVLFL